MSGLSSGEGFISEVADPDPDEDGALPPPCDKRLLFFESEFAKVLRVMERQGNTLDTIIRQAWDDGNLAVLTRKDPLKARGAHISIIGHITDMELRHGMNKVELGNGFANRFIMLLVKRAQCLPYGGRPDPDDYRDLAKKFREAVFFAREVDELHDDDEAQRLWVEVYPQLTRRRPGLAGAVCQRAEAHVRRLAMLYALLDRSATIREPHLRAALGLWEYAEASALYVFMAKIGHRLADHLLAALRANYRGLTRTEIRDLYHRNKSVDEIDAALELLVEYGLASCQTEKTEGRPSERWFAIPTKDGR